MPVLPLVIVATAFFVANLIREPRSFWNAVLLLLDLGLILMAMSLGKGIWAFMASLAVFFLPLLFFGTAVFLIVNGVIILKKERRCLSNTLPLCLGLFMIGGSVLSMVGMVMFQEASVQRSLLFLALALECYLAFSFAAFFLYSWLYTLMPKRITCDYIIVHGCGLKNGDTVTPLLKGRLDKAVEVYRKANNHPKLVVSGGKGRDEKIPEAQAMKHYLLAQDFPEEDILTEEMSTTTLENLKNVRDMLDQDGVRHRYIFVTNNYHVFRTGLLARKLKMKAQGVGCRTAVYYWPCAFIREYIAVLAKYKWAFAVIIGLWALIAGYVHWH